MDSAVEKGHLDGESACAAEMRAHKYGFGGVSEQLNYILPPPNGLPSPPRWRRRPTRVSSALWERVKGGESRSLVKDFLFHAEFEVGNVRPSTALESHYRRRAQLLFFW